MPDWTAHESFVGLLTRSFFGHKLHDNVLRCRKGKLFVNPSLNNHWINHKARRNIVEQDEQGIHKEKYLRDIDSHSFKPLCSKCFCRCRVKARYFSTE